MRQETWEGQLALQMPWPKRNRFAIWRVCCKGCKWSKVSFIPGECVHLPEAATRAAGAQTNENETHISSCDKSQRVPNGREQKLGGKQFVFNLQGY